MINICRICLNTDGTLEELYGKLLEYFHEICGYTSGFKPHFCCSSCKESLENNLNFKNKCLKSNKLYQKWKRDKSQKKHPIQSLQDILKTSLNNIKTKKENTETEKTDLNSYEHTEEKNHNGKNTHISNKKNTNSTLISKNDVETVKDEQNDFELINCGPHNDINNHYEVENDENEVQNYANDMFNGSDHSDDDKFLIDCVREKKNRKEKKTKKDGKSDICSKVKQEKRVYPRKGQSWYSQYETVFDIQLFTTDEDARKELVGRRVSEPYVSARYRCEVCFTVYKCDKLLQFHMKWHDLSSPHVCDICAMRFSARKALQCHKAKCHRGRFQCKLCPLITYYGAAMKAHFQKHQGKVFTCHCNRVFNHISSYLTHKRITHASSHVCVTCARTFVSELGLLNHRLRAHQSKCKEDSEGTARCDECNLTFANQEVYTVHVLNTDAHKEKAKDLIACSYCGLSFDDHSQLKTHKRQNHPKKKDTNDIIKCKLCEAEGRGRVWRRRHYAAEHPLVPYLEEVSEAKVHVCDRCGKRFTNICVMKDHMNSHTGLKPYSCGVCRAAFSSGAARALHAARHAPPRRACPHCGNLFRSASNLAVHMRTHSGVRRHACETCGKAFLHRAALREHVRGVHRHVRRTRGNANRLQ